MRRETPILDLLELEDYWSEAQRAAVDQVRRLVDQEILPVMPKHHQEGTFPEELIRSIAKMGILELVAAGELDPITYGLVLRELERAGSEIRSFVSVQGSLVMSAISFFGSEAHKQLLVELLNALTISTTFKSFPRCYQ